MKIVICGDTHIGAVFGLGGPNNYGGNTRVDDYEKTLDHIVNYCISNNVDIFVQTGDVFEKRNPTHEQIEVVNRALKKLSDNGIFSIVMMGNHDYKKVENGFISSISSLAAKDYFNSRLVLSPEVIKYANGKENVNLLILPYVDRRFFGNKTTQEDSMAYEQLVLSMSQDLQPKPIAIGHNFYYDGSYTDFGGTEILTRVSAFENCDFVAMGHQHTFKIVQRKNPIAIYTGSMEKLHFGDADTKKVFIEYNTESKNVKVLESPTKELFDKSIDLSNSTLETISKDLEAEISKLNVNNKIVRIKIQARDNLISTIKKANIEKELYLKGASYVSKVWFEQIYQKIIRDTSILEHSDDFEIFKAFIKNQNYDSNLEEQLLKEARTII